MKILVCITHVPDTTSKISFIENDTKFNTSGIQYIIGPYDEYALARAIELKSNDDTVTVICVGGIETEPTIRKALAIGADDAIRVNADPTDALFVATQIANLAKDYDLILTGRETIDFNGGIVHTMIGEILGIPTISPVMKLDLDGRTAKITKEIEGGKESLEVDLPLVAGCQEPIAEWKIPNMRGIMSAKSKPLTVVDPILIDTGMKIENYQLPPAKGECKIIDSPEELLKLLKNEAKVL